VSLANLALVYEKLRDYRRALELYDRAVEFGADIDWILLRKAATLTECGRYRDAKVTLKRYLSLAPDDASQWIALGILHSDDEEYESAFDCYERAEALDSESPSLRLNWGVTAVRACKLAVARAQLQHLQRLEPRSTRPWLLGAFILEEEGELTAARAVYDRVVRRTRFQDHGELMYAYEWAMDFYARHKLRSRCERLFTRAYAANACTVELCEAHREISGEYAESAYWFSMMVEADYRPGLSEVCQHHDADRPHRFTRFLRDYQVIAHDRDEAIGAVLEFLRGVGEKNACVREFIGEEKIEQTYVGIYEVETEALVFSDEEM
jgi:tetratricopeptide (TPR) repeat protein